MHVIEQEAINIIVKGKPIAKRRPRFARRGKFVVAYNDQETEESRFLWEVKNQIHQCLEGALIVYCCFHMPRPKNHYKVDGKLKEGVPVAHTKKPDLDNLLKFIFDCLNGVAWKDDSQIATFTANKVYGDEPKTEITIRRQD